MFTTSYVPACGISGALRLIAMAANVHNDDSCHDQQHSCNLSKGDEIKKYINDTYKGAVVPMK